MTATEELRRLLDERGIDWEDIPIVGNYEITRWHTPDGHIATYCEDWRGCTVGMDATPKQAIAATIRRGTCRNVHEPPKDTTFWPAPHFKCSECGVVYVSMDYVFYCPRCGREVIE